MKEIKIDKIIRSKRKTVALTIKDDATLVVRAPLNTSLKYINELVFKKRFWIKAKKLEVSKGNSIKRKKEYVNGEGFLYLGKTYKLKVQNCDDIKIGEYLFLPKKFLKDPKDKLIHWYKEMALKKITERANWYSKNTGWKYKSIKINNAQSRWGSCGPNGSLNFSWRLVMTPVIIIDYVVVHELAHTQEKNHSIQFWNKVKTVLPNYEKRELWLKENRKYLYL